jgi:hypothetical protein
MIHQTDAIFGHAIYASEVAAVRDGDAEVVDGTVIGI